MSQDYVDELYHTHRQTQTKKRTNPQTHKWRNKHTKPNLTNPKHNNPYQPINQATKQPITNQPKNLTNNHAVGWRMWWWCFFKRFCSGRLWSEKNICRGRVIDCPLLQFCLTSPAPCQMLRWPKTPNKQPTAKQTTNRQPTDNQQTTNRQPTDTKQTINSQTDNQQTTIWQHTITRPTAEHQTTNKLQSRCQVVFLLWQIIWFKAMQCMFGANALPCTEQWSQVENKLQGLHHGSEHKDH